MCIKAVEVDPWKLYYVCDPFKIQEMCDKAVKNDSFSLVSVLDWFVAQQQIELWDDDDDYYDDDEILKWYEGYK